MAQRQDGDAEYRDTLLKAAALAGEHDDHDRLAAAALANSRGYTSEVGMVDDERVAVLRSAVEALPDGDPRQIRLRSMLSMELHYGGDPAQCRELSDRALAEARELGEPATLAHVLIDRWFGAVDHRDRATSATSCTPRSRPWRPGVGDPLIDYWVTLLNSHLGHDTGDRERVLRSLARAEELSEAVGEPFLRWLTMWNQGSWAIAEGRLDEGEQLMEEGVAYGMENDQNDAMIIYASQLSCLRREQGRMDEVVDLLISTIEDNPRLATASAFLAHAYMESGQPDEAREVLESLLEKGLDSWPVDLTWGTGIVPRRRDRRPPRPHRRRGRGAPPARALRPLLGLERRFRAGLDQPLPRHDGGRARTATTRPRSASPRPSRQTNASACRCSRPARASSGPARCSHAAATPTAHGSCSTRRWRRRGSSARRAPSARPRSCWPEPSAP